LTQHRLPAGPDFGPEAQGVPLRVLVVEASGYSAGLLEEVSHLTGLVVELSRNPRAAVDRLQSEFYDAVVIDLPPPLMPPEELFRRIVAIDLEQAVRVVFLVNDLGDPETRKFLTDAGRPWLTQPVDPAELHELVLRVGLAERADE
jgi:DNA-binding response OmpR family regulator